MGFPCKWTADSKWFILENFDTIQDYPARMYNIAPVLCPPSSWLHECYSSEFSHRTKVVVGSAQWGSCIRTVLDVAGTSALAYWNNNIATTSSIVYDIIILDALTGSQTAVFSGHTDYINTLKYSSDGTFLVSGSTDETIKLWDVQTGGIIKTLFGHTHTVYSVSLSADNTMIASASADGTICLWNIKTGSCCIIGNYSSYTNGVTFSPTNSQLLFSSGDYASQQWNINGDKIGSPVPGDYVAFSPDGTQFVSLNKKTKTVTIRSTDSQLTTREFDLDSEPANYCCFSPNGRVFAVAVGYAIQIWDITGPGPYLIQTFIGHSHGITLLVFSSPYSLISASHDESIKFWQIDVSSADPDLSGSKSLSPTLAPIKFVSLQAKDSLAFSIDSLGVVKTWDISTGCCKESYKTQIGNNYYADIQSISNRLIIVCARGFRQEIDVWDAEKGKLHTVGISSGYTWGLRITGDGSRVLQLYDDSIQAWDIWTGEFMGEGTLKSSSSEEMIRFDSLRMDDSRALVRFGESSVQGWDFGTPGSAPIQFSETSSARPHLNFINVREWLENSPVRIEDGITGKEVFQLCGRYAKPSATQWDGWYLIAGYQTGEVLILDFNHVLSK